MFGGQEVETKRFDKVSNKMRLQGMKMVSASSISDPDHSAYRLPGAGLCPVAAASFPSVMDTLTAGTITVVFSSMIALMRPLKSLTNVNAQFQRGMAACQTLFAILDSGAGKRRSVRGSLSGRKAISSSRTSPLPTRVAKRLRWQYQSRYLRKGKTRGAGGALRVG